jgi:hypothetical protein
MYGEKGNAYRIRVGMSEGKRSLEDLYVGGKLILRLNLERYYGVVWTGSDWIDPVENRDQ